MLFLATHFVPSSQRLREVHVERLKLNGYKVLFNLPLIVSIILIVYGLKEATFQPLREPLSLGRHLAMFLMLPAIYFFLCNSVGPAPSPAKVIISHPINWGVILWATAHMLANCDLATNCYSARSGCSVLLVS